MKIGDKVKDAKTGRVGISQGPTVVFGVEWILVEWEVGGSAIILEKCLEVISEVGS